MAVPRLFVEEDLAAGHRFEFAPDKTHYLINVMRLEDGAPLSLFNGRDGEWAGDLVLPTRKRAQALIDRQTRPFTASPDLDLLFAPLKKDRTDFAVEKATELGVRRLFPVITERTNAEHVRPERLRALAIEAAEQSERLDAPDIAPARRLEAVLRAWPGERVLLYADEQGDDGGKPWGGTHGRAPGAVEILAGLDGRAALAVLVGPEGGFAPAERALLRSLSFVRPLTLGPRILRAETAVAALLALVQALWGDWR